MRTESSRLHLDDNAIIIVAVGALIAVAIVVSAITTNPGGSSHRLLHSRDASGGSPPSAVETDSPVDEVLAVRIVADGKPVIVDGHGMRTLPAAETMPDTTTAADRAVRIIVDEPAGG